MLRRLALRDFVIVDALELDFDAGFSVLTGETGAGKSILVDALQLVLGARGDAGVVREGAQRAEISAEFDADNASLAAWLDETGFERGDTLLLRRTLDAQGKSRAWINGSAATVAQLRELGERLVDIHGQHAWQGLTRPASVRALLDAYAGIDAAPMTAAWTAWRSAEQQLAEARQRGSELARERERLLWQIGELDKLAPLEGEWDELNAEQRRLSHAQAILDGARQALDALREADSNAERCTAQAVRALDAVAEYDPALAGVLEVLRSAEALLADASHTLHGALGRTDLDPRRLDELDSRMATWMGLARRFRRTPQELPATLQAWRAELAALDAAADLEALQKAADQARSVFQREAKQVSAARRRAAPRLADTVSAAMQRLGMAGGRFEVALESLEEPQAHGLESIEFLVAGHAGSTPRPLGKVASGGELSRIALAIAVTTSQLGTAGTLIFDEVDAGVGGAVAETVGRMMQRLGRDRQVLAVTHLPQVAACADAHQVVSKTTVKGATRSSVGAVTGEARVAEIARMLGGQQLSGASLAHAKEMLAASDAEPVPPARGAAPEAPVAPTSKPKVRR